MLSAAGLSTAAHLASRDMHRNSISTSTVFSDAVYSSWNASARPTLHPLQRHRLAAPQRAHRQRNYRWLLRVKQRSVLQPLAPPRALRPRVRASAWPSRQKLQLWCHPARAALPGAARQQPSQRQLARFFEQLLGQRGPPEDGRSIQTFGKPPHLGITCHLLFFPARPAHFGSVRCWRHSSRMASRTLQPATCPPILPPSSGFRASRRAPPTLEQGGRPEAIPEGAPPLGGGSEAHAAAL